VVQGGGYFGRTVSLAARASAGLVLVSQRMVKLQPETSRLIRRILAWKLISIARQPVLLAASRCHLIQMLRSALPAQMTVPAGQR
jgi:hypothetical protein